MTSHASRRPPGARGWTARLAPRILRGPLLNAWLRRKARRFEALYARELLKPAEAAPAPSAPRAPRPPLRCILLIADVMWENDFLVPELKKIADVQVLDLHPGLAGAALPAEAAARAVERFISENTSLEPDAILLYAAGTLLSDEVFGIIRGRWKSPLIGMNLDDRAAFPDYGLFKEAGPGGYGRWARSFDLNLTNGLPAVDWYRRRGAAVHYCPQGFHPDPALGPPSPGAAYAHELSFVGSRRADRAELAERLLALGLPLAVFGKGWPGARWEEDVNLVYRSSQVNLGIGSAHPFSVLTNLKGRDFECPGAGACYLTTYHWELGLHFDIGREILCYHSVEELAEIFTYYRKKPEECGRIARAAYDRCLRDHTWERRFREVFSLLGFSARG